MQVLVVLLLVCLTVCLCDDDPKFNYGNGLSQWGDVSNECNGAMQSPIALTSRAAKRGVEAQELELQTYYEDPTQVTVTNDGHTAVFSFVFPKGQNFIVRGGPLQGIFQFESLHFHWGANSARGAEHVVDKRVYAMEMHLVFYNQRYGSFQEAQSKPNGLAVLGIFFTNSTTASDYGWVPSLNQVQQADTNYTLPDPSVFNIKQLIGARRKPYFNYRGSLTTPPCFETVNWLVQKKPLPISERQLDLFRALRDDNGEPLVDNYRSLQAINGRQFFLYR